MLIATGEEGHGSGTGAVTPNFTRVPAPADGAGVRVPAPPALLSLAWRQSPILSVTRAESAVTPKCVAALRFVRLDRGRDRDGLRGQFRIGEDACHQVFSLQRAPRLLVCPSGRRSGGRATLGGSAAQRVSPRIRTLDE
jgi:hypothetical protein